jgi:hypothetical protein
MMVPRNISPEPAAADLRVGSDLFDLLTWTGSRGLRIAKSGRRFRIEHGVVSQLINDNGVWRGQAATFSF